MVCSLTARAELFEGWTNTEKVLFATSTLALLADFKSTSSVLYPDQGYKEMNPFLGEHPGQDRLTAYFLSYMVINYLVADHYNHKDRERWLLSVTIVESIAAGHNVSIGATIKF